MAAGIRLELYMRVSVLARRTISGTVDILPGFDICTGQHVDKVLIANSDGTLRASAVQARGVEGTEAVYQAKKEDILTAGAYGSPAILLRSGVCQAVELTELGIETISDLPGVGKTLQSHLVRPLSSRSTLHSHKEC